MTHASLSSAVTLSNEAYSIRASVESFHISRAGNSVDVTLIPELSVFTSTKALELKREHTKEGRSPVISWNGQTDLWSSGEITRVRGVDLQESEHSAIQYRLEETELFSSELRISLPEGNSPPVITWTIHPKQDACFSAGFSGIASQAASELDFLYQPLVWTWKRFPDAAYLTPEAYATTGASFFSLEQRTEGLHVHPDEVPFRYASTEDSRFGLCIRDADGQAKPMIFAPILGGTESKRSAGDSFSFSCTYFLEPGSWQEGIAALYENVIRYRDERQNHSVTLNQTLDNMIRFAMDDEYSGWIKEWKGADYVQDAPGTVKNVSALHPISVALTRGSSEIYRRRGLPMTEYMMSREKYLFGIDPACTSQSPSPHLKGPCAEIGELAGLDQISNFQNEAFAAEIDRLFGQPRMLNLTTATVSDSWQDYLARYRITQDPALLEEAKRLADAYLDEHVRVLPVDFASTPGLKDRMANFVTDFGILWYDLFELYEATGEARYLEMAEQGAMQMLLWIRSFPFSDPGATHCYNPEGVSVMNEMDARNRIERGGITQQDEIEHFERQIPVARQEVPQWQASFVGLLPESSYTYFLGSINLTQHAAWMLRLAQHSGNRLLADTAYNAIIGRYANYPGYYVRSSDSNIYQHADYPMKRFKDGRYNNLFYNHVWPQIALLQDFLVSDAFYRSGGKIDFPSVYAPGYAFLQSKVYGHKPGRIYGNEGVSLWLPEDAVVTTELALNHLLGRDDQNSYLVLMNTSDEEVTTSILLNRDLIPWSTGTSYSALMYDAAGGTRSGEVREGRVQVQVPAKGIQTVKIEQLSPVVTFESGDVRSPSSAESALNGFLRREHPGTALGTLTAMRIRLAGQDSVYMFSDAGMDEAQRVSCRFKVGEYDWELLEKTRYPFEFSIPVFDAEASVTLQWTVIRPDGGRESSDLFVLRSDAADSRSGHAH